MGLCAILCYHKVGPLDLEGRRLNVAPETLRDHVDFFFRRRWPYLLPRDLSGSWPDRSVCFTFDDAYQSALAHAPPVLERRDMRGCFYAVPSLIGRTSEWDGGLARPLAEWSELRGASGRGHEIGNHSMTHAHLDALTDDEARAEIASAHEVLSQGGIDVRSFCYPYGGLCDRGAVPYQVGLALGKRPARSTDDLKRLPRIVVACSDRVPMLLYKIWIKPRLRSERREGIIYPPSGS